MPTTQATPSGKKQGSDDEQQQQQEEETQLAANPLPRRRPWHAVCLALRGEIEMSHRGEIYENSVRPVGPPRVCLDTVQEMRQEAHIQSCNRSVPVFLWPVEPPLPPKTRALLLAALHNFLYRTWFKPFRSEIDWGQFIAQTFEMEPDVMTRAIEAPVDMAFYAAYLCRAIYAHVDATKRWLMAAIIRWNMAPEDPHTLCLRPLFRAVAIIIKQTAYSIKVRDIGQLPILLVLTGIEEGLSAPITFELVACQIHALHSHTGPFASIQAAETSLATAVRFVMDLEKREEAAFGPRPDPRTTNMLAVRTPYLSPCTIWTVYQENGWDGKADLPAGSSATWVDTAIYPYWIGEGARCEEVIAEEWERDCRRLARDAEDGGEKSE
ncbi:hypothetical protein C8A05DRAFT_13015 [Staphylotrichum tortipilum]|uniref:Uncharacterized protein n=1 Tax=Staphylotrichum tortipilum TaxID=2831512 RepID=A0AAN6MSF6_9PEZI|nr:hypothetical protein C8A05DRAFT_13015 [Staphylotrichum longicolle]